MTFAKLADRVQRITGGSKAEILQYLYEAQTDFIMQTDCMQKRHYYDVSPSTGTITAVSDSSGSASYACESHGLSVDDYIMVHTTTYHNGVQKVTAVTDADNFVTDQTFDTAESDLSAGFQYGFLFALPSDFLQWVRVEWRGVPLNPIDREYYAYTDGYKLYQGYTEGFSIEVEQIRLLPMPDQSSALVLTYSYYDTTTTPASPIIPTQYQPYLVDYVANVMFEGLNDGRANRHLEKYLVGVQSASLDFKVGLL